MSFLLSVLGYFLLAVSILGIIFGVFMAMNPKTREAGKYFALWWVPGAAAASGVVMKDIVTFTIGFVCFCVAGAVFGIEARRSRGSKRPGSGKKRGSRASERTTAENAKKNYRRRAS